MADRSETSKLGVINGLRGFSILAVFCYHLFSRFVEPGDQVLEVGSVQLPFTAFVLHNAWIGVNVFFLLSGFVLYLPYAQQRRTMVGEADVKGFYLRRFRRLMPLFYVNIVAAIIFLRFADPAAPQFFPEPSDSSFFFDAFFMFTATFNFVPELYAPPLNWVLWSLGIEIWFSLLFPLVVYLANRLGIGKLTLGVLVVSLVTRVIGEQVYAGGGPSNYLDPIKDSVIGRLDDFVLGMLLCHLYLKRGVLRGGLPILACLLGAIGLYLSCWAWDHVSVEALQIQQLDAAPRQIVPFLNNLIAASVFLLTYGALSLKSGLIRSIFSNWPIQILGMMCYSLYVWHGIAIFKLFTSSSAYDPVPLVVNIALILLFSALSYRYIEFGWEKNWKRLFSRASE